MHVDGVTTDIFDLCSFPDVRDHAHYLRVCTDDSVARELRFILDSGSDCSILPLHMAGSGVPGRNHGDAQGKVIKGPNQCRDVELHLTDRSGCLVKLKERFVVAAVSQPLLSLGKFMKQGWQVAGSHPDLYVVKEEVQLPVTMQKNSLAMDLQVCRITDDENDGYFAQLGDVWTECLQTEGWSSTHAGEMVHVAHYSSKYFYPDKDIIFQHFPDRSTLVQSAEDEWELLECAEMFARKRKEKDLDTPGLHTVLTVFHAHAEDLDFWGPNLRRELKMDIHEPIREETAEELQELGVAVDPEVQDVVVEFQPEQRHAEAMMPVDQGDLQLGPEDQPELGPELLEVNGQTLHIGSSLREMRRACQWLGLSKNGSKQKCWLRLKVALAEGRRNLASARALMENPELIRDPTIVPLPALPSLGEQEKHMVTHLPRADWCEACHTARSREDNFKGDTPFSAWIACSLGNGFT